MTGSYAKIGYIYSVQIAINSLCVLVLLRQQLLVSLYSNYYVIFTSFHYIILHSIIYLTFHYRLFYIPLSTIFNIPLRNSITEVCPIPTHRMRLGLLPLMLPSTVSGPPLPLSSAVILWTYPNSLCRPLSR